MVNQTKIMLIEVVIREGIKTKIKVDLVLTIELETLE